LKKLISIILNLKPQNIRSFLLIISTFSLSHGQEINYYIDHLARISFPNIIYADNDTAGGSDVWGYTDKDGNDYAIMGVLDGTIIINVEDLNLIETIPGPEYGDPYFHRDMMTYNNYLYICHEMTGTNEGIQIVDLSALPDSIRYVTNYNETDALGQKANTSHNLFIDKVTSTLLAVRKYYNGVRIISLSDPEKPEDISVIETPDAHDMYSNNDTIFIAEGWNGSFSIWDAKTDKINPKLIARVNVPASGYVHSVWSTDDNNILMTAEETSYKTIKIWDISDMNNIKLLGNYLGPSNLAHNIHIKDNFAYISHYSSGISIIDISNPYNPKEIVTYDTYTTNNSSNFFGAWGVYPYSPNNYIYVSNIEGHLDVLRINKQSIELSNDNETFINNITLKQNYPNPFNNKTKLLLTLDSDEKIILNIYNSFGRKVQSIVNDKLVAGNYSFDWNGAEFSSGIYFARLETNKTIEVKKMILIK